MRCTFDESGSVCGYSTSTDGSTWTAYYYVKNLQGDVIEVFRASDNTSVATFKYDSWGFVLSAKGTNATENPFRYRGYVYDSETELYYLQSRYYNPEIGRFLSADVVFDYDAGLQGFNLFAYCGNNPINRVDISGADSAKIDDADIVDDELSERGGGSGGFSGGWSTFMSSVKDAANGLSMASGSRDSLLSEPKSPEQVSKKYIDSNNIDAHGFKRSAGKVPPGKLSKYNIYKDKANHNRLWVGSNNVKNRDWRMTPYFFDDLILTWRK